VKSTTELLKELKTLLEAVEQLKPKVLASGGARPGAAGIGEPSPTTLTRRT